MFAALLIAAALVALWTVNRPWFAWSTAGAPSCVAVTNAQTVSVMTSAGSTVSGVYAAGCQSGADLVASGVSPVGTAAGVAQAYESLQRSSDEQSPQGLFGMPRPVALFVGCALLGAVGVTLRNGLLSGAALLATLKPYAEFGSLRELMLTGNGGSLTAAQYGAEVFGYALLVGAGLLVTATAFVVMVNAAERKHAAAVAVAKGEPKPATMYDHIATFLGGKLATVLDATERARTTKQQAPSSGS